MVTNRRRTPLAALVLLASLAAVTPSRAAERPNPVEPTGLRTVLAYAGCALSVATGTALIPAVRAVLSCGSLFLAQTE